MRAYERLIKYAMVPTASNENSAAVPTTECQFNLAHILVNELQAALQQDLSAVTAACFMVKKEVFEKVGGFEEKLAVAFNDVDFCLKVRHAGYLVVYDPYAELYHHESKTRGYENTEAKKRRFQEEIEYMRCHWMPDILRDPYYNENLSLKASDYSLRS